MSTCCILLAAGTGARFGSAKQLERLAGRRLVDLAVDVARQACGDVVLVLPPGLRWEGAPVTAVVAGGTTRSASVRNGLSAVPDDSAVIVVHDAAHPLATPALYGAVIGAVVSGASAASPFLPVAESLVRREGDEAVAAVPKGGIVVSQTPHAFRAEVLRSLLGREVEATDEVSLLISSGTPVTLVAGDPANIHVTTRADIELAARIIGAAPA